MKQETLDKLAQKVKEAKNYLNITDIPKGKIRLKLGEADFKTDKFSQECFFANLIMEDGKIIVQKYTTTQYVCLFDKINKVGRAKITDEFNFWQMENVGRAHEPRLFPVTKTD